MYCPSITTILGVMFIGYIGHSIYQMSLLFSTIQCSDNPCYTSFLISRPRMQLGLFTSTARNPISSEVKEIYKVNNFNYLEEFIHDFEIELPPRTRRNGTMYMQVVLALEGEPLEWRTLRREGPTVVHTVSLTEYILPRIEAFNLLGDAPPETSNVNKESSTKKKNKPTVAVGKPVTHIRTKVFVNLLTDNFSVSQQDVPPEISHLLHVNRHKQILPILKTDFFNTRLKDLVQVNKNLKDHTLTFQFKPMSIGKLRLMLLIEHAMSVFLSVGFVTKDVDEVKGIFSDTNMYLLCCTVLVAGVHLLFDFLSFKNDVIFWRSKKTYTGLSTRTTLWRAFSQVIIFLYLLDEDTSYLVLVPAGFGAFIEIWKCKKILRIELSFNGIRTATDNGGDDKDKAGNDDRTDEFDKQGMHYLTYILYPLCLGGAVYSLIYQPHRSWYSWTLNSLVNGVYAFGFLFMLPQLFVNYKLKSVAALPWRAFMYKAFNTFIDDFFAFIITMPTAHRVACLRDDIVFLIYLYQRWLYPVDQNRIDSGTAVVQTTEEKVPRRKHKNTKRD